MANVGGPVGSINQFGNEVLPGVQTPREEPIAPPEMIAADEARDAARNAPPPRDADGNTIIDALRATAPLTKDKSDYELSRIMYDAGGTKAAPVADGETYAQYATRVGVKQGALETLANKGLSTAALHLNEPAESALSGLASAAKGDGFMSGYRQKGQEIADQNAVGSAQNPWSALGGDAAGTIAPYTKFGPAIRGMGSSIPGVRSVTMSSPLADSIAKFGALTGLDRGIQSTQQQVVDPEGTLGQKAANVAGDTALGAGEGALGALAGSGISKGLSSAAGPLIESVGQGMSAADQYLKGVPRSLYTRVANRLSQGFTGAGDAPDVAAAKIDSAYYNKAIGSGSLDAGKATDQLASMIENNPGAAKLIMESALKHAPPEMQQALSDAIANVENGDVTKASGIFRQAVSRAGDTTQNIMNYAKAVSGRIDQDGVDEALDRLTPMRDWLEANRGVPDNAGGGQSTFLGNIYRDLIPQRLQGSLDPAAAYERNTITGALNDRGKLVQPPLTGTTALGQALYERMGGGPGRVVGAVGGALGGAPLEAMGGTLAKLAQPVSATSGALGAGLQQVGKAVGAAGEPGATMFTAAGRDTAPLADMPNFYQSGAKATTDENSPASIADAIGRGYGAVKSGVGSALNYINPFHTPTPPPPAPENHTEWMADPNTSLADKTAFVGARLPQIASQLKTGSEEGDGAALTLAMLNPSFRNQL